MLSDILLVGAGVVGGFGVYRYLWFRTSWGAAWIEKQAAAIAAEKAKLGVK